MKANQGGDHSIRHSSNKQNTKPQFGQQSTFFSPIQKKRDPFFTNQPSNPFFQPSSPIPAIQKKEEASDNEISSANGEVIQRAIAIHKVNDANNSGAAANAASRKPWLGTHIKNELIRILNQSDKHQSPAPITLANLQTELGKLTGNAKFLYETIGYTLQTISFANPLTENDILSINDNINQFEIEMGTIEKAPTEIANTKIGNEFTFTNASLTGLKPDPDDDNDIYNKMVTPYNLLANAWKAAMTAKGFAPHNEGADRFGLIDLTYKFNFAESGVDWGYRVTPDHMCVEVITDVATGGEIFSGHIGNLMDNYIFGIANEVGIAAHRDIGGGHINIDEKSAFGPYEADNAGDNKKAAKLLLNFMHEFYKDQVYWKQLDPDEVNAVFPSDINKAPQFQTIITDFNEKNLTVTELADQLIANVFVESKVPGVGRGRAPHYQALNVEHLKGTETEATRRLEVRRVPAQANRGELIAQLNQIAHLLRQAGEQR